MLAVEDLEYRINSDWHFKVQPLRRIATADAQSYTTVVPLPPSLVVIVMSGELMGKDFRLRISFVITSDWSISGLLS